MTSRVALFLCCVGACFFFLSFVRASNTQPMKPHHRAAQAARGGQEGLSFFLIRHGEAQHNLHPDGWKLRDPSLTGLGVNQAKSLRSRFQKKSSVVVLASPLLRTLQTARLIFPRPVRIIGVPELQEIMTVPSDTGSPLAIIRRSLDGDQDLDLTLLKEDEDWWKIKPEEGRATEKILALVKMYSKRDQIVVLVTHQGFIKRWTGEVFSNCEVQRYELDEATQILKKTTLNLDE